MRPGIPRLSIREQRDPPVPIETIELKEFTAAIILREDDASTRLRLKSSGPHRLRQESELAPRATRHFHVVELHTVRETRRHQHLATLGVPTQERRRAEFQISTHIAPEFLRNWREIFRGEIFRHRSGCRDHPDCENYEE